MRNLLIAVMVLLATAIPALGGQLTGPIVNPNNGHSYYLLTKQGWNASEAEAQTLNGHLVTINDAAEDAWVFATFGNWGGVDRNLWIGLNDAASEGTFVWVSGEPVGYTNWDAGQPNDFAPGEDYGMIWRPGIESLGQGFTAGKWNDQDEFDASNDAFGPYHGVVEVIPEPTTLALLALGGLALARRHS